MTVADLAELVREATLQGSVLLHSMQDAPPDTAALTEKQLQGLWDR
jgi:hypothetical protein